MIEITSYIKSICANLKAIIRQNTTVLTAVFCLSVLYVLPILLANTHYIDDLNRTIEGYAWDHDGRYGSSFLMHLLSFQIETVFSLFPYSTIISACLVSLSGFIISYSLGVRNKIPLVLGSVLLTTCPFILEIFLYRFDCLPISLSILSVTFPFLFYKNKWRFLIASVVGLSLCFSFYQTTTLSYAIVLCLFLIKDIWKNNFTNVISHSIVGFVSFLVSFFLFKLLLKIFNIDLYQDGRADFIFTDPNLFQLLSDRYQNMMELIKLLTTSSYRYTIYIFILIAVFTIVIQFIKKKKIYFNLSTVGKIALSILLLVVIIIAVAGINMVVYNPRWVPRGMIGWGFAMYVFYLAIVVNQSIKYRNSLIILAMVPLIHYSFLMSSQLGMYIKNQDEFSDYIISLVSPKLISNQVVENVEGQRIKLIINGTIRKTHRNHSINNQTMPFIIKLAPVYENNEWAWGIMRFNKFNNINSNIISGNKRYEILKNKEAYPIIDQTIYYTLRLKDDIAILDFND